MKIPRYYRIINAFMVIALLHSADLQESLHFSKSNDEDSIRKQYYFEKQVLKKSNQEMQESVKKVEAALAEKDENNIEIHYQDIELFEIRAMLTEQLIKMKAYIDRLEQFKHLLERVWVITEQKHTTNIKQCSSDSILFHEPISGLLSRDFSEVSGLFIIAAKDGEDIYAIRSGRVKFADNLRGLGLTLIIEHDQGYSTVYANCSKILCNVGDNVSDQELIGTVGHTAHTGLSGLYFEIRKNDHSLDLKTISFYPSTFII
ncbi:MAG: M23 family metallopeptidase [Gammaproteobacteria bacterium]|nr:M23 family metallopeptidase [Gammaproteobacteria bacterium]